MRFSRIFVILACMIACLPLRAAETPHISLLTCHAGPDIYELCGHSGIRINYPESGIDFVVNYGLYDFNSPNFIYRFVKGETDYMVGAHPYQTFVDSYRRQGRMVVEQQLALTPEQSDRLVALLSENLRPENRVYRYNYVLDNCATRCIDMFERAIGDTISFDPASVSGTDDWSFRDEMRHYHKNYPWYQFGIDLALGSGIDYPTSVREKSFAPEMMERMFAGATVCDSTGIRIPLVSATLIAEPGTGGTVIKAPTPWYLSPLFICWTLLAVVVMLSIRDIRVGHTGRLTDSVLFGIFGLAGCLVFFLVVVSEHYATSPNWLIVWINPLCFCGAILPWIKKCSKITVFYHFFNLVALSLLLTLWHCTGQDLNLAFIPLILADMVRSATFIYINKCNHTKNIA